MAHIIGAGGEMKVASRRHGASARMRWAAVFALLLCCTAVAGIVISPPPAFSEASEEAPVPPSELALVEATEKAEEDEAHEREERETPAAERERYGSRTAYADLSAYEAQSLLTEAFPEQLEALNADPARVLSELKIEKPLGTYAALVSDGEGESSIVESSVPVESEVGGEGKEPVDLTLERSGSSFVPQNPIAEVELPGSAEEPLQLQSGIEVDLPTSDDRDAVPLGPMSLFYPETDKATDTLLATRASGVEVFEQLRSPESPERFSFVLDLPAESSLRPREDGGAEVATESGEIIEEVLPPSATDAQGAIVPVTTSIEGDSLILEVLHRSRDLAYPILLDPAYVEGGASFANWAPAWNDQYILWNSPVLGAQAKGSSYLYAANSFGQWVWTTYGSTTYISQATFSPTTFTLPANCATEQPTNQPHGFAGLYNPGSGGYSGLGIWSGGSSSGSYATLENAGGPGVRQVIVGIGAGTSQVKHKCAFTFEVGGVTVREKDPEAPTVTSVGGTSASWVKEITVTPHASDPGLGVKAITLSPEGSSPQTISQGCTGATASRCPGSWETSFGVSYFAEGERSASITAYDPLGPDEKSHVSASYPFTTKLDRQKPEVELEGEFTEALEEAEEEGEGKKAPALHLPVYNLKIEATDKANEGNPKTEPKARRSGVKNIAVFLDGKEMKVPWEAQGCSGPEYSCSMNKTYTLPLDEVQGGGVHHLKVIVSDQVGNEREVERNFEYFPATGMKDEYVMQHFPLPDGEGNEAEEEHPNRPELAVNVTNGNLVYRQKDLEVVGPDASLEVERYYNSQLPEEDNTEWGDGWTLAQTPKLEPEETKEAPPAKASMVRTSGVLESTVGLPTESGGTQFDKKLQAVVTKEPSGGYTVADQSGETDNTLAFDEAGKVTEMQTSGPAVVNYSYASGKLSEIAVNDPSTAGGEAESAVEEPAEPHIYASSFGGKASGLGNLSAPVDTATDAEGNVWVADAGHGRVQEFNSKGEFVQQFGSSGTGNGQFTSMHGLAIDSKGNVWVAAASRVQEFNAKGEYIRQFGSSGTGNGQFEGLVAAAIDPEGHVWTLETGIEGIYKPKLQEFSAEGGYLNKFELAYGTEAGKLKGPQALAIDSKANFWIVDTGNNRIEEFNAKGEFTRAAGSEGTGNGLFKSPKGIATDAEGNVWVADTANNRVQEFSPAGTYMSQFGKAGDNNGQFSEPKGLAVDSKGNVWVADTTNNRVEEITTGEYILQFGGAGSGPGNLSAPVDTATDAEGNVWVADGVCDPCGVHNRVQEFNSKGEFVQQFGATGTGDGQFTSMHSLAIDSKGNVWVAAASRVQEFNSKGEYIRQFGSSGTGNGQFSALYGLAIDPEGHIWTIEAAGGPNLKPRLQEFSAEGGYLNKFEFTSGAENGQLKGPQALAIDSKANFWIADTENNRIEELNSNGEYLCKAGAEGSGNGQFKSPKGIAIDAAGNVWAADTANNRIEEFSSTCAYLGQFGKAGDNNGQFSEPKGIAIDGSSNLWVADTANNRVEEIAAGEYVRQVGGEGSGPGNLSVPPDTATDAEGNVWVSDPGHSRIQEFNSKGEFIRQFGAKGSGGGLFSSPQGITIDPSGNVWVADKGNTRIQEFNAKGEFILTFGKEVNKTKVESGGTEAEKGLCTATSGNVCQAGVAGTGQGQMKEPTGIACSAGGNLFVVETGNNRVEKFSPTGGYLANFGSEGTEIGKLKAPTAIAVAPDGSLWVADTNNNRIEEWSSTFAFTRAVGKEGTGNGLFKSPKGIATDAEGNVWVADTANNRVQEFSPAGTYMSQFGKSGNNNGQFSEPKGLTVDSKGNVWVADTANNRVERWQLPGWTSTYLDPRAFGGEGSGAGQLSAPVATATDADGDVWVSDTGHNRIQEFNSNGEFVKQFGAKGSANGLFNSPQGLAIDSSGNVWVADKGNNRIQEFNSKGEFIRKFGSAGTGNGQFGRLQGVAIDPEGHVWTIEMGTEVTGKPRVQEFSSEGTYITQFGKEGTENGQFKEPQGIAIDSKGNVWVADTANKRIQEFKASGEFIRKFGTEGTGNGQFKSPRGVATDAEGNVWVADTANNRVQEFSPAGTYMSQFGKAGDNNGQFSEPKGLAVDSKGNVWVADTNNNRVEEITTGEYVRQAGGEGSGAGNLSAPNYTATDAEGNVWVTDTGHSRIQEFNAKGEYVKQFGAKGSANGLFNEPRGIAIDSKGNVWVADRGNNRIQEFNAKGEYVRKFGSAGTGNGQFGRLGGIAIDSEGHVWTIEIGTEVTGKPRVQEFSSEGAYISQFGTEGTENGQFKEPQGIAVDAKGNVWVADTANKRIQEFKASGEFIRKFGAEGTGNGQFKSPKGITTDSAGNVWVADTGNNRVQEFSAEGTYISQFGKAGDNNGQFSEPKGLAVDSKGNVWVADTNNNRVEEITTGEYILQFGGEGTGPGQLSVPSAIATDSEGNVWVSDTGHNRIQEFNAKGEFVKQFGAKGSANGLLSEPRGIAIDSSGNVWIADTANNRIQELNAKGEYVRKFGSAGTGNGQFGRLGGIAIDSEGHVWTIEAGTEVIGKPRVQEFSSTGTYLAQFGAEGAANGQFKEPQGIAVDAKGNVWVADTANKRIEEFNAKGEFLYKFGSAGSEEGQLSQPAGLTIDKEGNIWVADTGNNRVEELSSEGVYLRQFGSPGNNNGQLSEHKGIAIDGSGNLWVADTANNRVEEWLRTGLPEGPPPAEPNPKVEVKTSSGLVSSVEGEAAGKITYSHAGETLTAVTGPKGEASYEYDGAKRLKKVSLPNGTWGEVKYDAYGRVESVAVSVEGAKAKTTHFTYKDEPRRTTVSAEGEPATVYDIAPDGSVLKWWNTAVPPEIENLSGSLYANKETEKPIEAGDYELLVQAYAAEGIASIEIVANGSQLVDEKTCQKTAETNCKTVEDPWVTNTGNWAPGILQLEVIVTDANSRTESTKFWVNIPYTPPPDPEAEEAPTFEEVLHFREEFGLDLDLKGNEIAIDERIFNLIGDWYNPNTPNGEVARATDERWGVPMRAVDAAELEYREQYAANDIPILDAWARGNYPGSYAGVYVDERSGGLIRMGFTSSQSASVDAARQLSGLLAPSRIAGFINAPAYSLASLSSSQSAIAASLPSSPEGLIVSTGIEVEANRVLVGATNVAEASSWLKGNFGAEAPILVEYEEEPPVPMSTRRKVSGPLYAGDLLVTSIGGTCSAGFGAMQKLADGKKRMFALTAAHCFQVGDNVRRENSAGQTASIGSAKRSGRDLALKEVTADTVAVGLNGSVNTPRYINQGRGGALPVKGVSTMPRSGTSLCHAGYGSDPTGTRGKLCGKVRNGRWFYETKKHDRAEVLFCFEAKIHGGDSGGPVWIRGTHTAVGLATHGRGKIGKEEERETCATALLPSVVDGKTPMPEDAASLTNSKLRPLTPVYAP